MSAFLSARRALPHCWETLNEICEDTAAEYADRFQAILDIDPKIRFRAVSESIENEDFTAVHTFISHPKVEDCYLMGIYLYCGYRPRENVSPSVRELNGCFIDTSAPRWKICAYPPPSLRHASEVSRGRSADSVPPPEMRRCITRVDDGVRITVGWVGGILRLFTTRGYFMERRNYFSDVTFETALEEALGIYGLTLADIPSGVSYTFVLHDGRYQPFEKDVTRLTLIEATPTEGPLVGVSVTRLHSEEELGGSAVAPSDLLDANVEEFARADPIIQGVPGPTCVDRLTDESELWRRVGRTRADDDDDAEKLRSSKNILYGYMVQRTSDHSSSAAVLLESPVLRDIRELAYDKNEMDDEVGAADRFRLHALAAVLRAGEKKFHRYFPQEASLSEYGRVLSEVSKILCRVLTDVLTSGADPIAHSAALTVKSQRGVSRLVRAFAIQILESPAARAEFQPGPSLEWKCRQLVIQPTHLDLCARALISSLDK